LDRLVASGWILRERSQTDKRQQNIHLSTAGAGLAEKAFSVSLNYEAEMLRHLTHGEQAMLRELLVKVARNRKV
jgi:DNA-binding MarR family transcriptional regulator